MKVTKEFLSTDLKDRPRFFKIDIFLELERGCTEIEEERKIKRTA